MKQSEIEYREPTPFNEKRATHNTLITYMAFLTNDKLYACLTDRDKESAWTWIKDNGFIDSGVVVLSPSDWKEIAQKAKDIINQDEQ